MKLRYDIDSLDNRNERVIALMAEAVRRILVPYFRAEVRGVERVPAEAVLFVGNHNGGFMSMDSFLWGQAVFHAHGMRALPFSLGHDVILSLPGLNHLTAWFGAVRASPANGRRLFEAGRNVLVYPGGDLEVMRPWRDRDRLVFGGRTGYVRLAIENGVPILPVVAAGAHSTLLIVDDLRWFARLIRADRWLRSGAWPIALSIPWGLTFGPPPLFVPFPTRILIELLEPLRFERSGRRAAADKAYVRACADRVEGMMQRTLTRLAAERRRPRSEI